MLDLTTWMIYNGFSLNSLPRVDKAKPFDKIIVKDGAPFGNTNASKNHVKQEALKQLARRVMGVIEAERKGTTRIPRLEKDIVESAIRENYKRFENRSGGHVCGVHYANCYYLFRNNSKESCRPAFRIPIVGNEERIKRLERRFGDDRL